MKVLLQYLKPHVLFRALGTAFVAGIVALFSAFLHVPPPLRRWYSRTNALINVLDKSIFRGAKLSSPRRSSINVVINSCELRTGSAFRFGNKETGSWRYGRLVSPEVSVATAVAASAAFPLALPALDKNWEFEKNGERKKQRVVLTDGGVYENLGVSCLEPGRSNQYSFNIYTPKLLICCDAGQGMFNGNTISYWWRSRVTLAFETIYRNVQTAIYKRLHFYQEEGKIDGFILSYLGQVDAKLPIQPPDLVPREAVTAYPTNFSAMSQRYIDLISKRGEQLTRLLVEQYWKEFL